MMKRLILFLVVVLLTASLAAGAAWAGQIFAVDGGVRGVFSFDATTGTLGTFIPGDPNNFVYGIYGEACLPDGRFLVTDQGRDLVQAYDGTNGEFLGTLITAATGSIPTGIAVTPSGNFLVGMEGAGRIVEYRPDGSEVGIFSEDPSLIPGPFSMAYGPNGNLFVAVGLGSVGSVVELNRDTGEYVREFPVADGPRGLTFGPDGHLFVASVYRQIVEEYDLTSDPVSLVRTFSELGQGPHGVLVGPDGVLYVGLAPNVARFRLSDGVRLADFAGAQGGSLRELLWSNGSGPCASAPVQNPSNGHWYQRFDTSMTWHQARDFCDAKGGYLATITSQPEDQFVYGTLASVSPQWTWLGATDEIAEGTWKWVTPEAFSYTNWADGEPNNCNTENYLMYFTPGDPRAGSWNDLNTGPSSVGVPGGCGCGGCAGEWYPMSTICEWGGFCTKAPAGMVSWWTGDGNANDSADGNHGTLVNGATFAQGKVGPAFTFDGLDDHVRIPHNENLNPTGPFSVDAWIKADPAQFSSDGLFVIIDKSHGFIDGTGWVMQGYPSDISCAIGMGRPCVPGEVIFGFGRGVDPQYPGDFVITGTGKSVLDNQWHHLAGVFTGGELQMYLDGVLTWSTPHSNAPVNNTRDVVIGRHGLFDVRAFHGLIDEVEFFNRALTQDEVKAIYLTGAAGKCINVTIDIRPGGFPNSINPFSRGVIPVAVVTTPVFDAATVDTTTVLFGPNGAAPVSFALQDFDLDGDLDLILQFTTQQTGIVCGTTSATLTGKTLAGHAITGTDSVNTVGCR